MIRSSIAALCLLAACAGTPEPAPSTPRAAVVRPGIETFLADVPARLRGRRVGLITNHTGIDRARTPDIDLIARHRHLTLVALLAPEHGIRGDAMDGVKIADEVDPRTGVPIHSLYKAEDGAPTDEMLRDVDVLVYDLQEVGGRTWTYVSTMALAMQAAARKGIPFVVLDRPNPIGGEIVEGALLDPRFRSFVGMYPIPARHGMTVGELATLFNRRHGIGADLIVARAANWKRSQWHDATGLPWVNPSPNLRSHAALMSYPGTVYFEGTTLTEGRGTDRPFEYVGAPWLDAPRAAALLNGLGLRGVVFDTVTFTPEQKPYHARPPEMAGQRLRGLHLRVTDRDAFEPYRAGVAMVWAVHRLHPERLTWNDAVLDRLAATPRLKAMILAGRRPEEIFASWRAEVDAFRARSAPYLLYR